MSGLALRDYERALDLVVRILDGPRTGDFWPLVTAELTEALCGSFTVLVAVRWSRRDCQVESWAPDTLDRAAVDRMLGDVVAHGDPLVRHYAVTGDREPLAVTDVVDDGVWRGTGAYRTMHAAFGVTHHIALPLRAPTGVVRALITYRTDNRVTDRERALLRMIQPLLLGIDDHLGTRREPRTASHDQLPVTALTPRELTVLPMLAEGLTADAIARRLAISPRTVHRHVEHIYRKLNTSDRVSTVLRGQELGLINL